MKGFVWHIKDPATQKTIYGLLTLTSETPSPTIKTVRLRASSNCLIAVRTVKIKFSFLSSDSETQALDRFLENPELLTPCLIISLHSRISNPRTTLSFHSKPTLASKSRCVKYLDSFRMPKVQLGRGDHHLILETCFRERQIWWSIRRRLKLRTNLWCKNNIVNRRTTKTQAIPKCQLSKWWFRVSLR